MEIWKLISDWYYIIDSILQDKLNGYTWYGVVTIRIIEEHIPKSPIFVQKRFTEHNGQLQTDYAIVVREKRYERLIIVNEEEMDNIIQTYNKLKAGADE